MNTALTKDLFLNALICPTYGWFLRNLPNQPTPTEGDLFRMEQGKEIGRLARSLFKDGQVMPGGTNEAASKLTEAALIDPGVTVAFECTFVVGNYVAKPDIILREGDGWRVIEVKSNLADTDQLDGLIDDLAYTVMVMKRTGVNVVASELMLICREYRKGHATSLLFKRLDQTKAVEKRVSDFEEMWIDLDKATSSAKQPKPKLISFCRSCPHFETDCLGTGIEHSVFTLPRLHPTRLSALADNGIVDVKQLPKSFPLTNVQKRVVECIECGKPWISQSLKSAFGQLVWPVTYLDFETVMSALPLYDGHPPYAQVTTQYSLHRRVRPDADLEHREFLADPMHDCEEELADRLVKDCGTHGSIVVYSSFEKTRITGLSNRFPKLSTSLQKLTGRLFDLLRVIQDGYYHPEFGGSFSIKVVLPVLVPELRYDGLAIGNGDTAVARFARAAMGKCSSEEIVQMRQDLLAYCKQDTLAMVRLHESLHNAASA